MIKILYPKPGEVSRMGGLQLLEVEADTEVEIIMLGARIDDGNQVFVAAPGSIAHTPDHSSDWEFSPAGMWVKRGGGTPVDKVILLETELRGLNKSEGGEGYENFDCDVILREKPKASSIWVVGYNGREYMCPLVDFHELYPNASLDGEAYLAGNFMRGLPETHPLCNTDAPFSLSVSIFEENGRIFATVVVTPVPLYSTSSVTLSIVEKGEAASVDGGSSGVVFVNGAIDPNGGGDETNVWLIPDKSLDECKALIEAGNYLVFRVDGGNAMGHMYIPLCEAMDNLKFSAATNMGSIMVTLYSADATPQCVMSIYNFA